VSNKVLIGFERSGAVRDAMLAIGIDAMSCDLVDTEVPGSHYKGDVRDLLWEDWAMAIFHPECRYLTASGLHWNTRPEGIAAGRPQKTAEALALINELLDDTAHIEYVALENPAGAIGTQIRPADFYIQPYNFGADASKRTGWWTKNLPKLKDTELIHPRWVCQNPDCKHVFHYAPNWALHNKKGEYAACIECFSKCLPRWGNQTDSNQNKLGPSDHRAIDRARTYPGVADALADQWGRLILNS